MEKMQIEEWSSLLKDLCNLYVEQFKIEWQINDLFRWDVNITKNLHKIILDLFNFPKDNTSECFDVFNQVFINWKTEDDIYCRDYLSELFFDAESWEELYNKLVEAKKENLQYWMSLITIN